MRGSTRLVAGALVFGRQTEMGRQREGVFAFRAEFGAAVEGYAVRTWRLSDAARRGPFRSLRRRNKRDLPRQTRAR